MNVVQTSGAGDALTWQWVGAAALLVGLLVLVAVAWGLRRVLFVWPVRAAGSNQPIGLVPLLLALLIVPAVPTWALGVASGLVKTLADTLAALLPGDNSCGVLGASCPSLRQAGQTAMSGALGTLQEALASLPLAPALLFFVLCFVLSWVAQAAFVQQQESGGPTRLTLLAKSPGVITGAFVAIILFAFYLCLSALLALPLMQKEAVADGFDTTDLEKALSTVVPDEETFYKQYVILNGPQDNDGVKEPYLSFVTTTVEQWGDTLHTAYRVLTADRAKGIDLYRSQNAEGLGGRESVAHYAAISRWYTEEYRNLDAALATCLATTKSMLANVRRVGRDATNNLGLPVGRASSTCDSARYSYAPPPDRQSRADNLPIVKDWTGWLIRSESVPLTIIVGLVGFSFLGAGLSRIVRAGVVDEETARWLSVGDLLLFVLSGAAASLSIFVASYGGLAVLGGDGATDPNPYVVFVLCLVAAIYSEDVWRWLRKNVLKQVTAPDASEEPEGADGGDSGATDATTHVAGDDQTRSDDK